MEIPHCEDMWKYCSPNYCYSSAVNGLVPFAVDREWGKETVAGTALGCPSSQRAVRSVTPILHP